MMLPQHWPQRGTLECHGIYRPTEAIGGDYFDMLECDEGGTALVVADVSGHGLPAALLMANLQASFRSREKCAFRALGKLLRSVNDAFYQSSLPTFYATVFIGMFDHHQGKLRYVNCAHSTPLLLRTTGDSQWLDSTATAVGMFPQIECTSAETSFDAGDMLVAYTDGITEAERQDKEPFGTRRIETTVRRTAELPVSRVAEAVITDALKFSGGSQTDDMTVMVARARSLH
jgi:sigma-B regulation protein RsbU (phosphoserine phosphatase)